MEQERVYKEFVELLAEMPAEQMEGIAQDLLQKAQEVDLLGRFNGQRNVGTTKGGLSEGMRQTGKLHRRANFEFVKAAPHGCWHH
jgi:hypothetical protein